MANYSGDACNKHGVARGNLFGYDQIYAADNLGYAGTPFYWVTMPDQYTLSAFQTRERKPGHALRDDRDGFDFISRALDADSSPY